VRQKKKCEKRLISSTVMNILEIEQEEDNELILGKKDGFNFHFMTPQPTPLVNSSSRNVDAIFLLSDPIN